jgi:hypothetical protein
MDDALVPQVVEVGCLVVHPGEDPVPERHQVFVVVGVLRAASLEQTDELVDDAVGQVAEHLAKLLGVGRTRHDAQAAQQRRVQFERRAVGRVVGRQDREVLRDSNGAAVVDRDEGTIPVLYVGHHLAEHRRKIRSGQLLDQEDVLVARVFGREVVPFEEDAGLHAEPTLGIETHPLHELLVREGLMELNLADEKRLPGGVAARRPAVRRPLPQRTCPSPERPPGRRWSGRRNARTQ